jgi:hypothetical protein
MSPSADNMRESLPTPGDPGANPGPGGSPVAAPQNPNPQAQMTAMLVAQGIQSARRLGMMYPAAQEEARAIANLYQKMQGKIVNSQPAPESSAPPV